MWRKIHSNRDPRDTLYKELRKEFDKYFSGASTGIKRITLAYPRLIYGLMVFLLSLSSVISFAVLRLPDKPVPAMQTHPNPVSDGFSRIMQATGNIKETLQLKSIVDSLSSKKNLNAADSALLESTLDRLSKIHQTIK